MPASFNFDNTVKPYSTIPHHHLVHEWLLCSLKRTYISINGLPKNVNNISTTNCLVILLFLIYATYSTFHKVG